MRLSPYLLLFALSTTIASFAQVLLKKSALKTYPSRIREYLNVLVICGYGLMFVGMFLNVFGYRYVEYRDGSVVESIGFLLVMILSRVFFGEKITARKILGNLLIFAGIAIFYLL